MRVALAEDSVLLRDGLARLLNDEGFEVVAQCGDAAELMRKLSAYAVDIAIVDIRLPPTPTDEGLRGARDPRDLPGNGGPRPLSIRRARPGDEAALGLGRANRLWTRGRKGLAVGAALLRALRPVGDDAGPPGAIRPGFDDFVATDSGEAFFSGAWGWFAVICVLVVFNTVLGEELLFRGLLLPRMRKVFGKRDWVANGALFTVYHLHMPWVIPNTFVDGILLFAYPSRRFQSAWMGIIAHSAQSVVVILLILGLVLK